jgi:DNA-binding CsgD family transcriptional regulator
MQGLLFSEVEVSLLMDLSARISISHLAARERRRQMLEGMCRLAGTDYGAQVVLNQDFSVASDAVEHGELPHNPLCDSAVLRIIRNHLASIPHLDEDGQPHSLLESAFFLRVPASPALEGSILSAVSLPAGNAMSLICLTNSKCSDKQAFTLRQWRIVQVAHRKLRWSCDAGFPRTPASQLFDPRRPLHGELAPRFQRVLNCLLAGHSEKSTAGKLGLSRNTIHEYVRAIYKRYKVNSRGELLAIWVAPTFYQPSLSSADESAERIPSYV